MIDAAKIESWRRLADVARGEPERWDFNFGQMFTEAVPALLAERDDLLALLREVEWGGGQDGFANLLCSFCGLTKHAPDCRLAAALRGSG